MNPYIWIFIGIIVVLAAALVIVGLRNRREESPLDERLNEYIARGEEVTLEEIELSQPITERIIVPIVQAIGELTQRFTPQNAIEQTEKKLELAGNPPGIDPTIFWASRFIAAAGVGGLLLFVFSMGSMEWTWGRKLMMTGSFALIGFFMPQLLLQSKINTRQDEIRKSMPDALDLLTICVQAGLGFDAAMTRVAEKWEDALADEFARTLREIQLGNVRRIALRNMADRIGISEMTSFVAAIIQSEQLGVSMAKVLRIQSDQMRTRRRQRAEEKAQQAPVKMLFPMALLIFPSLLIILLGPAALQLKDSALAGMFGG
ncbi:MAG: type II secretion system F family protein [Chloroflexota bacterium]|nr:MAG: type II secretion system F family protein [Chloroflexota bacterium]